MLWIISQYFPIRNYKRMTKPLKFVKKIKFYNLHAIVSDLELCYKNILTNYDKRFIL